MKNALKATKTNFKKEVFATLNYIEIEQILSSRLVQARLFQNVKQSELASRTGLSLSTIKNFESGSKISFQNILKIISALNLKSELEDLFLIEPQSIAELEKMEHISKSSVRKRAR